MEIGIELLARNKIYLHPQIRVGIHQSSYLTSINAFSVKIQQLDDEVKISIPSDVKLKNIWRYISNFLRPQRHGLIKHKTTLTQIILAPWTSKSKVRKTNLSASRSRLYHYAWIGTGVFDRRGCCDVPDERWHRITAWVMGRRNLSYTRHTVLIIQT